MIARIWHGTTRADQFEAYSEYIKGKAIPDYRSTQGFVKLSFLRRLEGELGYFTLITYWESLEVIKGFAGEDYEKAKIYPEAADMLLEYEERVFHHEVFAE
ncbi:MAG: antibiotic biosynthesis monooxygenase [Bacteroidota bacterium]